MYGYGSQVVPLNKEEILKRVSEKEIFSIVFKEEISLDLKYTAPYREDKIEGCYFEIYNNQLVFVDFADVQSNYISKDCFNIVSRVFQIDYLQTLQYINKYFKLGLGGSVNIEVRKVIYENIKPIKQIQKNNTITFVPRPFTKKDKEFWEKYEISANNLKEDKVFSISLYTAYSRNNDFFCIKPFDEIMYAYTDFPDDKVKIYRPNSPQKEGKWFTNCNQDNLGSINTIPKKGDLLIISKSYKDSRVLRNLGFNSVWTQNEGMFPNEKILKNLCGRFKKIVIWFDNDSTGIAKSSILKQHIDNICTGKTTNIFLPPILLREHGIKDPSDCIVKMKDFLLEFINEKVK